MTSILSKVVTGVLDEMVDVVESAGEGNRVRQTHGKRYGRGNNGTDGLSWVSGASSASNMSGRRTSNVTDSATSTRLPLTDEKWCCMGCGNHCRPVRPNCKKRQKALAKWRPY